MSKYSTDPGSEDFSTYTPSVESKEAVQRRERAKQQRESDRAKLEAGRSKNATTTQAEAFLIAYAALCHEHKLQVVSYEECWIQLMPDVTQFDEPGTDR